VSNTFQCTSCGLCCRSVGNVLANKDRLPEAFKKDLKDFPYTAKEDGSCEKLVGDKCSVYKNRPDLCNIETRYNKHYSSLLTKEEFYETQYRACQTLIISNESALNNIPWHQQ
jgi:Fe-S-cluster containining protein